MMKQPSFDKGAIFIDRSAFSVYMNEEHPFHRKASSYFFEMDDLERPLVTVNLIIYELHEWLLDNAGYDHAQFFLNCIQKAEKNKALTVIPVDEEIETEAVRLMIEKPEYELTFLRACALTVMNMFDIKRIFSFDPYYNGISKEYITFQTVPSQA
jgi:predicted nucleic acid-binding protein